MRRSQRASDLFDDILAGAGLGVSISRAARLGPRDRRALMEALELAGAEAEGCAGMGRRIEAIVRMFEARPERIVRFDVRPEL